MFEFKAILIRGPQGSGKTTLAKHVFPDHALFEADDYFMVGGKYCFEGSSLKDAHKWTQWRAFRAYHEDIPFVVCSTFSRRWEIEPYLSFLCPAHTLVVRMSTQFNNVHGVPDHVVQAVSKRFEDIQGEVRSFDAFPDYYGQVKMEI